MHFGEGERRFGEFGKLGEFRKFGKFGKGEAVLADEREYGNGKEAICAVYADGVGSECGELDAEAADGECAHRVPFLAGGEKASCMHQGAGNHGICHSRGGAGGHCHCRHHAFPPEDTGAMGCHSCRHQWPVRLFPGECHGQGTLEYALVMVGFLSVVAALASLWRVLDGGVFVEHALMSASHHVQAVSPGVAADVFLF